MESSSILRHLLSLSIFKVVSICVCMCDVCMHMYVNVHEEARGSCFVSLSRFTLTLWDSCSLKQLGWWSASSHKPPVSFSPTSAEVTCAHGQVWFFIWVLGPNSVLQAHAASAHIYWAIIFQPPWHLYFKTIQPNKSLLTNMFRGTGRVERLQSSPETLAASLTDAAIMESSDVSGL